MPALSQCVITGELHDVNGDLVPAGTRVTILKTVKSGAVILHTPVVSLTDANGAVSLTVPRASTISVYAKAVGLEENGPITGVDLTVPNAATANLEDLVSISAVPSTGLTVKDEGAAFASLVGTINFVGTGVSAVETSAGLATVTITAGSGVTLREVDGAPSIAASTLEFAQASGFVVTDQTGGVGRVDVLAIPVNKLAALTVSRVPVTDGDGFLSASSVTTTTLGFLDATSSIQTQMDGKQPLDADLTAIAALTPTNDDVMQRKAGAWVNRSVAQLMTDLSLSGTNTGDQTSVSGNAGTATALQTARNINGVAFDGTANITITAAAGTLSGNTLAAGVTASSLTSFGSSPTLTTPTISGAIAFPDNVRQTFNPGADAAGLNVGAIAGDPGTPSNGDLWYDSTANELTARINGANVALGAGGGGGATTALDNLASVAINTDLLPASTQSLGNASFPFLSTFTGNTTQYVSVTQSAGLITHAALGSATNIGFLFTPKGTGGLSNPGAGANSERFGASAVATGARATVFGSAVNAAALTDLVAIGDAVTPTGGFSVCINHGSVAAAGGVSIGYNATGSATQGISIGNAAVNAGGITVGFSSSGTAVNHFLFGHSNTATSSSNTTLIGSGLSDSGVAMTLQIGGWFKNVAGVAQIANGTIGQWGSLQCGKRDADLNTAPVGLTIGHQTSGTKASIVNPFGVSLLFNADSTTTADQNCAQITALWTTPTHASVVSDLVFYTRTGGAALAEAARLTGAKDLNLVGNLQVSSTKVVGAQGAAVADASGGGVIDAEARTALNALLARLRTHGLIAT